MAQTDADGTLATARSGEAPIVLVVAASDLYAPHLTVSLHSALRTIAPHRRIEVHVLDGGISPARINRIKTCLTGAHPRASIWFIKPEPALLAGLRTTDRYPAAVYLRLMIPALLPLGVEKAIYIDSDVVVTEDIAPLFDMNMQGRALWAVRDAGHERELARLRLDFKDVSFCDHADYFNAGVLLMNLSEWRSQDIGGRALDFIRARGTLCKWFDQDALNLATRGDWGTLPEKWNNQIHGFRQVFGNLRADGAAQGVLHFAGKRKPWEKGRFLKQDEYLEAVLASGWHGPAARLKMRVTRLVLWARKRLRQLTGGVGRGTQACHAQSSSQPVALE